MAKKTITPARPAKAAALLPAPQFAPVKAGKRNINIDVRFMVDTLVQLLRTPSPTGYTAHALHLVRETADLWFHSLIVLAKHGLGPGDVLAEMHRREGISGLDEKAARKP